jgi:hypothetical protein
MVAKDQRLLLLRPLPSLRAALTGLVIVSIFPPSCWRSRSPVGHVYLLEPGIDELRRDSHEVKSRSRALPCPSSPPLALSFLRRPDRLYKSFLVFSYVRRTPLAAHLRLLGCSAFAMIAWNRTRHGRWSAVTLIAPALALVGLKGPRQRWCCHWFVPPSLAVVALR